MIIAADMQTVLSQVSAHFVQIDDSYAQELTHVEALTAK